MHRTPTGERIRTCAGALFQELGYAKVTIRGVADKAGVSPALVMKLFGSKAALYAASTPQVGRPSTEDVPPEELGAYLVNRVVARLRTGETDPWAQAAFLTWQSPDPDVERRRFREQATHLVYDAVPAGPQSASRADAVVCQLVGLAVGLRTLHLDGGSPQAQAEMVALYGRVVQATLDEGL